MSQWTGFDLETLQFIPGNTTNGWPEERQQSAEKLQRAGMLAAHEGRWTLTDQGRETLELFVAPDTD